MYKKDQIWEVRDLAQRGFSKAEISKRTGISRPTVDKFLDMKDFNEPIPEPKTSVLTKASILDPYKSTIDSYLEGDKKYGSLKQSHTARRCYERLRDEEGYTGSLSTLANYFSKRKKEFFPKKAVKDQFVPLVHRPGEAQGDFGKANYIEKGVLHNGRYFILSFPQSNAGYIQVKPGENTECLLEAMRAIFEYIGGVPPEIWLDNASTMIVTKTIRHSGYETRKMTERFQSFCMHYQFKPYFMNPNSGNEKGNVERKVSVLRHDLLVPVPAFDSMDDYNEKILERCLPFLDKKHYRKKVPISTLYEKDKQRFLPLPTVPFTTEAYLLSVNTDKYGFVKLEQGKRIYSTDGDHASSKVRVKLTSKEVTIMDEENNVIVVHDRLYAEDGNEEAILTSMNWLPYLKLISMKPHSLRNSGIYEMIPAKMRAYLDTVSNHDRGKVLKVLWKITEQSGFESAVETVTQALATGAKNADSLDLLYRRIFCDAPSMPELKNLDGVPKLAKATFDPSIYDYLLKGGNDDDEED